MVRTFFIAAALLLGMQARANLSSAQAVSQTEVVMVGQALAQAMTPQMMAGIFHVGDSADYNMNMSFITGKVHMFVRNQVAQGYWVETDVDAGMMGKQKVEVLYGNNGQVLQMIVNGQQQTPPSPSDEKIVAMHPATITVPKGTFQCEYIKIHDNSQNTDEEVWVSRSVPVEGMVKTVSQSQIGPVTLELTNFTKGN